MTLIFDNFDAFQSPIDKTVIKNKRDLAEHNKRHGVTNAQDYTPEYMAQKQYQRDRDSERGMADSLMTDLNVMADAIQDMATSYDPHMQRGWITYDPNAVFLAV